MVKVNIAFTQHFFKRIFDKLPNDIQVIDFALAVLELLMFKVCGITGISKIEFFIFPVLKGLKDILIQI